MPLTRDQKRIITNWTTFVDEYSIKMYQKSFEGRPAVRWKVLKHRHEPLKATVPMRHQHDEADEVEDAHEFSGDG